MAKGVSEVSPSYHKIFKPIACKFAIVGVSTEQNDWTGFVIGGGGSIIVTEVGNLLLMHPFSVCWTQYVVPFCKGVLLGNKFPGL